MATCALLRRVTWETMSMEEALAEAEMLTSGSRMLQRAETYCLYNIEYQRENSQIHHQAAPSRAQAPGAAVIGGT